MARRLLPLTLLFLGGIAAKAQVPPDSIAAGLARCWYANDGGTKGEYCFGADGTLVITPFGKGREKLQRTWSVDGKGHVVVRSGKHAILYLVEHLAADGFVLVNDKQHVRLEGHADPPKR